MSWRLRGELGGIAVVAKAAAKLGTSFYDPEGK